MKTGHRFLVRQSADAIDPVETGLAASSPTSSVIFAATVLADADDVLAVIRTAILLGKSFAVSTSIDLPGAYPIHIESGETLPEALLSKKLHSMQDKFRKQGSSLTPAFALEASITAASFLAAGTISVRIGAANLSAKRPTVAR
jgi:hypothetical protein